jgi:hypothetical protein
MVLTVPEDVMKWLSEFGAEVLTKKPTDLVHALCQLGVDDPAAPSDPYEHEWVKANQWWYNATVYALLPAALIPKLRRVIRKDLTTSAAGLNDEYGKIMRKDYAQLLLNNFLMYKPTWL